MIAVRIGSIDEVTADDVKCHLRDNYPGDYEIVIYYNAAAHAYVYFLKFEHYSDEVAWRLTYWDELENDRQGQYLPLIFKNGI